MNKKTSTHETAEPEVVPLTAYYKILDAQGRSCSGGRLTWSLPRGKTPGDWHAVDGELNRCDNGLHLTSEPAYFKQTGRVCYLAEYEGETEGPERDELVCRRVRLLRQVAWKDLDRPNADTDSPAYELLWHVWNHRGKKGSDSYRAINASMKSAVRLATSSGMEFHAGDFKKFSEQFDGPYWMGDPEGMYADACGRGAGGPNPSAVKAFEAWKGRTPYLADDRPVCGKRVRLCVGSQFVWFKDGVVAKGNEFYVTVTSFDDGPKDPHLIAVTYKDIPDDGRNGPRKIMHRFKITHAGIDAQHDAVAAFIEAKAAATAAE